ncbi:MAG: DUF4058 family protein [Phaeodactylibacter sp.]|nr:DUF4058 family protein [Phaeodactylibacter sp.]MCB9266761.1 DUF4058 family protein [Lewinellaceae bacterium]MCB9287245.1 DUF4058 family protein [Lewinellaceae bacterium]
MKPPFPGMDPWLEGHVWPDVHHGLAFVFKEQLVSKVVPKYFVRVETYTVEDTSPEEEVGIMYPDVEILKKQPEPAQMPVSQGTEGIDVLTPVTMIIPRPVIEVNIPVVEIRDRENQQLITAIEILSPVNKRGKGLDKYREKRQLLHEDGVHLLEVDLLRRGQRPLNYPTLPRAAHYFVMLSRGDRYKTEVWAMTIRDKLPVVPIPLKSPDPDVRLDIGAAFNEVYERSRYELSVKYNNEPAPPAFSTEDMQWLQGILKEKKLLS